jgi:hypothetical protein
LVSTHDEGDGRRHGAGWQVRGAGAGAGMLLALLGSDPARALDGDRLQLNASSASSYDDNLTRTPSSRVPNVDEIRTDQLGAATHLFYSRQNYDASVSVSRGSYRKFASQDYTAKNYSFSAATDVGNDGRVSLGLQQNQSLTPLSNFQALIRDLVSNRALTLGGNYALDARFALDATVSRTTSSNDYAPLSSSDVRIDSQALGASYALPEGSKVGLRESFSRANYPNAALAPAQGGTVYDPRYLDRRLEVFGSLSLTPITTLSGNLAAVDRSYGTLIGQDTRSTYGTLNADTASGGPLSGGASLRRELGGQAILASRVVETDGLNLHANYAWSALISASARLDLARRRYSVDAPGFPAHREYETLLTLGLSYAPLRFLSFGFDINGDWRRANPEVYSFTDRRYALTVSFLL